MTISIFRHPLPKNTVIGALNRVDKEDVDKE